MINHQMTFLVRQLQPTEYGLPIEIYVFSKDQVWANYEAIQADIFDHLFAALPEFGLRAFQNPTGADFARLTATSEGASPVRAAATRTSSGTSSPPASRPQRNRHPGAGL